MRPPPKSIKRNAKFLTYMASHALTQAQIGNPPAIGICYSIYYLEFSSYLQEIVTKHTLCFHCADYRLYPVFTVMQLTRKSTMLLPEYIALFLKVLFCKLHSLFRHAVKRAEFPINHEYRCCKLKKTRPAITAFFMAVNMWLCLIHI
jgi:hypothetical protein